MGGPRTQSNGQIVKRKPDREEPRLVRVLNKHQNTIKLALPSHLNADRMTRIAMTAVRQNPDLAECEPVSFLGSVLQAAQLGLEVNTPLQHAWLIPRNMKKKGRRGQPDKWEKQCTLMIGYQGYIELAMRSGLVAAIYAYTVHDGDNFQWLLGTDNTLSHTPKEGVERAADNLTHAYAVAKFKNGHHTFRVLTRQQIDQRRKMAKGDHVWRGHYVEMATKSAIRALFKFLPKSAEMARAAHVDIAPEVGQLQRATFDSEVADTAHQIAAEEGYELPPAADSTPEAEFIDEPPPEVRLPGDDSEREPGAEG